MTVNLAWRDAMAEVGVAFNKACQSAGWVDTFTPWQIAVLQRPNKKGDREGKLACDALFKTLDHDCKSGALAHSTLTVKAPPRQPLTPQAIGHRSWATSWEGGESEGQRRDRLWLEGNPPQTTKTEQQTHITAADFAAWLSTNQIDPSRHIAAWFEAAKVVAAREEPQEVAPVVAVEETTQERNERWLAVFDEEMRTGLKVGAQARAIRRIAEADGVTAANAKKGIQKAEKTRAEKYREGKVTPLNRKSAKPAGPFDAITRRR